MCSFDCSSYMQVPITTNNDAHSRYVSPFLEKLRHELHEGAAQVRISDCGLQLMPQTLATNYTKVPAGIRASAPRGRCGRVETASAHNPQACEHESPCPGVAPPAPAL